MWAYDLTEHLMVGLETIIPLATITYIVEMNLYVLHPMDGWMFNDFINAK